jgi:type IV pilus assembly protein PilM
MTKPADNPHQPADPALPAGSVLQCAHCQRPNAANRKFCSGCGKPLWEPCLNCGTICSADEAFCGHCGISLTAAIQTRRDQIEGVCREAEALGAQHEYAQALAKLEKLTGLSDHRLAAAARRVEELRARFTIEKQTGTSALETAMQEAELCMLTRDYEGVVRALEQVPEALLDEKAATLLRTAHNCAHEIASLSEEIEEGLAAPEGKDVYALLGKAERLLRLKPEDDRFLALKDQLQELHLRTVERERAQLCQAAKKQVDRFDYEAAVRLLNQVPLTARTPDLDKQIDFLSELAWLKWDLHNAPVIDPTLLGVAERLVKLKPDDRQTAQMVATLEVRARAPVPDRRKAAPSWVKAPEQTAVGCPVDWVGGFRRINGKVLESDVVRGRPGCFYVAAGLALQGLGAVPLRINLLPQKRSLLGLPGGGKDKQGGDVAWGLDLSSSGIKAIRLAWDRSRQSILAEACDFLELEKPLNRPDAETQWRDILKPALETFLARNDVRGARVCVAFSRPRVLGRFFRLPPLNSKKKIAELVRYETTQQIPYALDELTWDYEALAEADGTQEGAAEKGKEGGKESWASRRVVLVAAKRLLLDERLDLCRELGLKVNVVQSDCAALHNFFAYDYFAGEEGVDADDDTALAVLDIGCDTMHILFSTRRSAWFRTANFGSDDLTAALARSFQLTFEQAERLKRQPLTGRRMYQFDKAAQSVREEFLAEIQRTQETYLKIHPDVRIKQMFAVGGGMQMHGLLRHLRIGK